MSATPTRRRLRNRSSAVGMRNVDLREHIGVLLEELWVLLKETGYHPENPTMSVSSRYVYDHCQKPVDLIGLVLGVAITSTTTGNPNLVPEEADTTGLGVVFSPRFIPGFTMSVDSPYMSM